MNPTITKIATLTGHDGSVYTVIPSIESGKILSGSSDKIVSEWSLDGKTPPHAIAQAGGIIYALCVLPKKHQLLIGTSTGGVHVVDLIQKKETRLLQLHRHAIFNLLYSEKHQLIYSAGGDGSLIALAADDLSVRKVVQLCKEKVRQVALHPQRDEIAVACGEGSIRILDAFSLEEITKIDAHLLSANCVVFHLDGKYLISGGRDAHLKIWDRGTYKLIKSIPAHNYAVYGISFSPDQKMFATASRDKTIKIWDAETFEILYRIDKEKYDGHLNSVNCICWMEFHNYLVSAGDDRSIRVWSVG